MKTKLFLFLLLFVAALTNTTVRAQSPDMPAIETVIDQARAAFDKRDLTAFAGHFLNSPDLYYQVYTLDGQVILARGLENMKKMVGGYMQSNPTPTAPGSYKASKPAIRVNGNTAFATGSNTSGKESSQDFVVLEKTNGTWKISALTSQNYATGKFTEVK